MKFAVYILVTAMLAIRSVSAFACDSLCEARDISAALDSKDTVAQDLAKTRGLNHADRAVRTMALGKILGSTDVLSIQVDNFEGDAAAARFLPNLPVFGIERVEWNATATSFSAWYQNRGGAVRGTRIGENLNAHYDQVIIGQNRTDQITTCSVALSLTAKRDALEGPLRCRGVPHQFRAKLGL